MRPVQGLARRAPATPTEVMTTARDRGCDGQDEEFRADLDWCQYCGISAPEDPQGWLIARHRRARDLWIVRCPDHINHWALWVTGRRRFKKRWMLFG